MLDPLRVLRLPIELLARGRDAPEGLAHLVDRARHDEPEEQRERADDRKVVERDADRSWNPPGRKTVDAGTHCRRKNEAEEDERDDDLELPEGERQRDDRDHDDRRDGSLAGDSPHSAGFSPR